MNSKDIEQKTSLIVIKATIVALEMFAAFQWIKLYPVSIKVF